MAKAKKKPVIKKTAKKPAAKSSKKKLSALSKLGRSLKAKLKPKKPVAKVRKVSASGKGPAASVQAPPKGVVASSATPTEESTSGECGFTACEEMATTGGYCRYHYIANWRRLKKKERVLAEKRLNKYIEELTSRYPDEYLEVIRRDLASDKSFHELLQDLEIEEIDSREDEFEESELKKIKLDDDY